MTIKTEIIQHNSVLESYEIRPGLEVIKYIRSWLSIKRLANISAKREFKFFLDITSGVDRSILNSGMFEKAILDIIKTICIRTGYTDQLIDVGANIGNHTVCLAGVFKRVASIEPNPVIFKVLEANIIRNGIRNASCFNFGLAEIKSAATLVATSENHSLGKVKQHSTLGAGAFNIDESAFEIEHEIQLESTAEFFSEFSGSNAKIFVKIDVEGMEQEILNQMLPFIQSEEPIVGFEWYVREQLGIKDIIAALPNYTAYVVSSSDEHHQNLFGKALRLLFKGRRFLVQSYESDRLRPSYPLVILIPTRLTQFLETRKTLRK